ncbi:uncharacterized protein SOCEGT47_033380 [Sorangium cellulosum]|uniref:Uncharacterized protein n=1 Tax=Sorangium cellulosum TaxID=56 RepID=A0A4P2Q0U2_SORCE|nr:hypothetical protein [Sorangium cellulosum]AUX22825.1 uncharacterized protein SOCEGT47_033380 [Sorangium cellulosum]
MDWEELLRRVVYIRNLYRERGIALPPGEGLALALDEAEALGRGDVSAAPATDENAARTAHDAHVIWVLQENIETCLTNGLDLSSHLANIATGTTDYGAPAEDNRRIFFKDFEYEVFVMAALLRQGRRVVLAAQPNDPVYEFECDGLLFQLKHPNSRRQTERNLCRFNGQLREAGRHGIFVVGLEDMFGLADGGLHPTQQDFDIWLREKREAMEAHGIPLIQRGMRLTNVVGLVQTQTLVEFRAGNSQMRRLGNSCIMDRDGATGEPWWNDALAVLSCFNPTPVRASTVRDDVVGDEDDGERYLNWARSSGDEDQSSAADAARSMHEQAIRERAYFLWRDRTGSAWWDPVSNWHEAERLERDAGQRAAAADRASRGG